MLSKKKGMMFVLSSPSGVGKTTLTKKLAKNNSNFNISISHTTRRPRPNETNGKDYFFIDKQEFNSLIKSNSFFEHAKIFDNYYGTLKSPVLKLLSENKDVLFDIDWQGTQQLKKIQDFIMITFFILPPNITVLKNRLLNRHEGQEKLIAERMSKFTEEVSHWNEYNYVVVNDDLEICYNKILEIIQSEKKGISTNINSDDILKRVNDLIN
jgi:guanylate kinase